MADAILDLKNQTAKNLSYKARIAEKVAALIKAPTQLLINSCQARKKIHADFWLDPNYPPQAIAAEIGLERVRSLFSNDADYATFLAGKLKSAGLADAEVAELVPGVPDPYVVNPTATTASEFIAIKTE